LQLGLGTSKLNAHQVQTRWKVNLVLNVFLLKGLRAKRWRSLLTWAVLCLLPDRLIWGADFVFLLRNGDRLTGAVLAEDTNRVVLATSWNKRIEIPCSIIEHRLELPDTGHALSSAPEKAGASAVGTTAAPPMAPASVSLTDRQTKLLADLLAQYETDKISPREYQERRQRILSGSKESASVQTPGPASQSQAAASKQANSTPVRSGTSGGAGRKAETAAVPPPTFRHRLHLDNWHGNLQVGANLDFGTLRSETYNVVFQSVYTNGVFKDTLDYHLSYGKTGDQLSANRMDGSMKTEVDFKKGSPLYAYHLGAAGFDEIRQLDLSYEDGAGLGYHLWQRTNITFNVELGGSYQSYQYSNHISSSFASVRVGQEMTWKPLPKLIVTEKAQIVPDVANLHNYKMRAEATVSYPFFKNLTLNLNLIDQYDSQPPANVDHNDLQIISTLGYKF
jgi:putative salt-induced outer membrane protein YdiY